MGLTRREPIGSGLAAGVALSAGPLVAPGPARAQGKPGGILRVRGYDPPHFDSHQTMNFKTNTTLSFVYSNLARQKVGAGVTPGTLLSRAIWPSGGRSRTTPPWCSTCGAG